MSIEIEDLKRIIEEKNKEIQILKNRLEDPKKKYYDLIDCFEQLTLDDNNLYIISNKTHSERNLYKIGLTNNLTSRLIQLNTGQIEKLSVYYSVKVSGILVKQFEKIIHTLLDQYMARTSCEWFYMDIDIIKKIFERVKNCNDDIINLINNFCCIHDNVDKL